MTWMSWPATYDDALAIVAGDFNSLNTNFVCDDFGL